MKRDLNSVWNNVRPAFAHIRAEEHLISESHLMLHYKKTVIPYLIFNNKKIIDYGVGGGFLGKLLFTEYNINEYIGIDVSERSIEVATKNLKKWKKYISFYDDSYKFKDADIFISLACIQHFPDEDYFIKFLQNINNSNIKTVFLQIRYDNETKFKDSWNDENDIRLSCVTNNEYILNHLSNYKNTYSSNIYETSSYQYLKYETI